MREREKNVIVGDTKEDENAASKLVLGFPRNG